MLESVYDDKVDVVCIQEPYIDFRDTSRANPHCNETITLIIINVYFNQEHDRTLVILHDYMKWAAEQPQQQCECTYYIILGDFNRHSPAWDEAHNKHLFTRPNLDAADALLRFMADCDMRMALPRYIPTLRSFSTENLTRPDNVWVSAELLPRTDHCEVLPELQPPKTDHFPIITEVCLRFDVQEIEPRRNFRMTDWKEFNKILSREFTLLGQPVEYSAGEKDQFIVKLGAFMDTIQHVVEQEVPLSRPTPYSKHWWS
ncbi:hypothetical protein EWM64_g10538 [Hericium alpestre]|uniref:Endonuclease/exonuclease/phosphatase domain-containing protein n=1 Tax=Hericium alpestre TaxID=135208 RepID=A0A4Y9ZI22_9AGAM|nr:hypothetical protein EWM64_g10538 [Hericium alpestre]